MIARLLVGFYLWWHGTLHLPGAGWLIRRLVPVIPGLHAYPLDIPDFGTTILDFRDSAAFGMLNVSLGELGDDEHLYAWIKKYLRPGAVLWDVGANAGYFSLHLVRIHPELAAVHAFEPNPRAFQPLSSLFHGHRKVTVHPVGLGRMNAEMELNASLSGSQTGSLVHQVEGSRHVRVAIRCGDDYARQHRLPDPDILKIDVEAFEPEVLAGLSQTILRKKPLIFFEHHFLTDAQIRQLTPEGYALRFLLKDGRLSDDFADRAAGGDCLLIPPGCLEHSSL